MMCDDMMVWYLLQHSMHEYSLHNQELCWRAVDAIESGDLDSLAATITEAQQLFDKCAVQVSLLSSASLQ
jgi:hypothetical protein